GLSLLTRPTIGVALYLGAVLLILRAASPSRVRADPTAPGLVRPAGFPKFLRELFCTRRTGLPIVILAAFAVTVGVINFERWNSSFTFADYRYATYAEHPKDALDVLRDYGEFNLGRLWIGALYYGTGIFWLLKNLPP